MFRRAPNRATSSNTSLSSRPEPNNASISPRIFSVGDTRDGTGVVLPVQTLAVLYGTYARRHLHRWMDAAEAIGGPPRTRRCAALGPSSSSGQRRRYTQSRDCAHSAAPDRGPPPV